MSGRKKHRGANEYLQYLKGDLSNQERHAFERDMEADPFEREALEGLESLAPDQAEEDILSLHSRLRKRPRRKRRIAWYSAAASIASLLIIGTIFIQIYDFNPEADDKEPADQESLFDHSIQPESPDPAELTSGETATEVIDEEVDEEVIDEEVKIPQRAAEDKSKRVTAVESKRAVSVESERVEEADPEPEPVAEAEPVEVVEAEPRKVAGAEPRMVAGAEPLNVAVADANPAAGATKGYSKGLEVPAEPSPEADSKGDEEEKITQVETDVAFMETQDEALSPVEEYQVEESGRRARRRSEQATQPQATQPVVTTPVEMKKTAQFNEQESRLMLKEVSGVVQSEEEEDEDDLIIRSAYPSVGHQAFNEYIEKNMQYPDTITSADQEVVILKFTVKPSGEISDIIPVQTPGELFTREAIRLVTKGPQWNPALNSTGTVEEMVRLKIVFKE